LLDGGESFDEGRKEERKIEREGESCGIEGRE